MLRVLLVLWIGTLGADRLDFSGGHTFFIATPFLVLSPLILLAHIVSGSVASESKSSAPIRLPAQFSVLTCTFLVIVLISVVFGADVERGAVSYSLLSYEILFTALTAALLRTRRDASEILLQGASFGVLLCGLFSAGELISWISGDLIDPFQDQTRGFISFTAHSIGILVPRLSGVSWDPNRAGLLLTFYWFLLVHLRRRRIHSLLIGLAGILLLCTLSKTAIIGWLFTGLFLLFGKRRVKTSFTWRKITATLAIGVAACGFIYANWQRQPALQNFDEAMSDRFSTEGDSSGGLHLQLLSRGMEIWSSSPKHFLFGVGFASTPRFLSDIFQTKYANFHSLYVSMLVECGIGALVVLLLLILCPATWSTKWLPFVAGIIVFNVFYQSTLEPYFWFFIALMWMTRGSKELIVSGGELGVGLCPTRQGTLNG